MPTFCEIAGIPAPDDTDGISFLPALLGNAEEQEVHPFLYWEFYEGGGKQALRKGNWKAVRLEVRSGNPRPIELYDLSRDPSEENNIADQYPELVAEMLKHMEESHAGIPAVSLFSEKAKTEMAY
jgi:arylsulfatase A-like enzyme